MRWKIALGWFSKIILFFNWIAISVLLISYLAGYINPSFFWPIAFIGIGYPILLVINFVFILYWLYRKPKIALFSIAAIFVGWSTFDKTIGFSEKIDVTVKDSSAIRIMSYNVHMFKGEDLKIERNTKAEMLQLFQEVSPDIICFQEFYTRKKGENDIQSSLIYKLGYKYHSFHQIAGNDYDAYGIAVFSKLPIAKSGIIGENKNKKTVNQIQYVDIKSDSTTLRIYNVHLQSIGFKKEDYEFISTKIGAMEEEISSTKRIGGRLKRAFIKRSEQVNLLHQDIEERKNPYIVAGDFNDTPSSYAVNKIARGMNNGFSEKGRGWGVTYNGAFPNFQIDYIMASKEFSVHKFVIMADRLSDHYPIWSDLHL